MLLGWQAFEGVAADSAASLAENSCFASIYSYGSVVGLGLLASQQVEATATTATLTVPPKSDAPLADSLLVAVGAAGTVARTPQGGEGPCNATSYKHFNWQ